MAQSDNEACRKVLQQYIDGSHNGDADALREIFFPEAVMSGYFQGQLSIGTPEPFFDFVENTTSLAESGVSYKEEITSIEVVGEAASAVLKEEGFFGENYTDFFHLIKKDGKWKIISKTYATE